MTIPRTLNINTNPAGWVAAAGAIYAAAVMSYNYANHFGVLDPAVIVAAVGAVSALFVRTAVTPTADPVNGIGQSLVPAPPVAPPPAP